MQAIEKVEHSDAVSDGMLFAQFMLGKAAFGIDARLVQEVVTVGDLTPVHGAPEGVVGIRNLRGHIVTMVDMAMHLGLGQVEIGPDTRVLIIDHAGEYYGFLVDTVTEAVALDKDQLAPPPASLSDEMRERLSGVWRDGKDLTAILKPEALFAWD